MFRELSPEEVSTEPQEDFLPVVSFEISLFYFYLIFFCYFVLFIIGVLEVGSYEFLLTYIESTKELFFFNFFWNIVWKKYFNDL